MELTPLNEPLAAAIRGELERARVPGCSIAVCRSDGFTTGAAFGWADVGARRKATTHTSFHLFSGTKLYTAAALMRLAEMGTLALGDSVGKWLPDIEFSHPVTLLQLASHTSGLQETIRGLLSVHFPDEPPSTTAQALARYRTKGGREPGGQAKYRNVNFALLGEVISRASGVPYEQFVRRELLVPLGAAVDYSFTPAMRADMATGYIESFSPMRLALRFLLPAVSNRIYDHKVGRLVALHEFSLDTAAIGGLVGPASGFIPLLLELLSEQSGVLSSESKHAMLREQAQGQIGVVSQLGVGIGWKHGSIAGTEFWNHEGGGPGFTSETRLYPDHRIGVVILMNITQSAEQSRLAHRVATMIVDAA